MQQIDTLLVCEETAKRIRKTVPQEVEHWQKDE
jgi:hypothetical protein